MTSNVLNEIRKNNPQKIPNKGLVWVTMLIEYDYKNGGATVLRSFSRPAKESNIKGIKKEMVKKEKIDLTTNSGEEESLFGE